MPFIGHRSRTLARAKSLAPVAAEKSSSERDLRHDVPFRLISSPQPTTNQVVNQTFSPRVMGKKVTDG